MTGDSRREPVPPTTRSGVSARAHGLPRAGVRGVIELALTAAGAGPVDIGGAPPEDSIASGIDRLADTLAHSPRGSRVGDLGTLRRPGKLTERAYDYIRDAILSGKFEVGSVLPEKEISTALGYSRTPVRDALSRLLHEGLVDVGPRRQLIVRGFTSEHRSEVLAVREALESISVRRACEVMTFDDIDQLRLLIMRQRRAADAGNDDDFMKLDEEFHLAVASRARLPIIVRVLSQLGGFVHVLRLGMEREPGHLVQVIAEHEAIVDAIESRDPDKAEAALRQNLLTTDFALAPSGSTGGERGR